jgi:multidrug transporter EmrE-like cation transporter
VGWVVRAVEAWPSDCRWVTELLFLLFLTAPVGASVLTVVTSVPFGTAYAIWTGIGAADTVQ